MSYNKKTWVTGEIISASDLNNMENGISDLDESLSSIDTQLEATFARVDGYYEELTAGNAEQLVSTVGVEESTPYLFRTTGGSADVGDRVKLSEITGGTVAWNQNIKNGNFADTSEWTASNSNISMSVSDNTANVTATASGDNRMYQSLVLIQGHKYLLAFSAKSANQNEYGLYWFYGSAQPSQYFTYKTASSNWENVTVIRECNGTSVQQLRLQCSTATTHQYKNICLFDLTQMFGSTIADYIYSLEQNTAGAGVAWFRKLFPKPYYAYDAGSLLSVKTSAHKTIGFNQWDEEWEVGAFNFTTGVPAPASNRIRSKNFIRIIPGLPYYINIPNFSASEDIIILKYDANHNYLGFVNIWTPAYSLMTFTTSYYLKFATATGYGETYKNDICISLSWDGERDGEYEPYEANTYALDDVELRGIPKLDANNNLYYDGDSYAPDGTVTRKYASRAYEAGDATDGSTMITDGTNTVYKLTTPTTESADPYQETQICNDFGTEEFVDSRTVPMPVGANALYQANLRAKLEMAPDSPSGDGDYIVRQTDGINEYVLYRKELPPVPTDDGIYVLKVDVVDGSATISWVEETT